MENENNEKVSIGSIFGTQEQRRPNLDWLTGPRKPKEPSKGFGSFLFGDQKNIPQQEVAEEAITEESED